METSFAVTENGGMKVRLIDSDAYAAEMRKRQDNCRAWKDSLDEGTELYARAEQSLATFVEAALTLKNQPAVAAIPVEWLKKQFYDNPNSQWAEKCRDVFTGWQKWQRMQKEQEAR